MARIRRHSGLLVLIALLAASATADEGHEHQPPPGGVEQLGKVHFETSCNAAAQKQFDRAVALLHSFWFEAAAEAFAGVAATDPKCAMAHWGTAMTMMGNPFGWPPSAKALADGHAAVERARAAGAKTEREKAYVAAVAAFYDGRDEVEHRERALAYTRAMETIHRSHPEDSEAAVFYALALEATASPTDKTFANQLAATAILEKIFAAHPDHPGVAHYLIHGYDHPQLAARGLEAARRYAKIAPSAPHALHMPSHIFTRLGLWQESIDTNLASQAAAQNDFDRLHAMDYLAYAYLQQGQDAAARRVVEEMNAFGKIDFDHFVTAFALAAVPSRYALERGAWQEAATLELPRKKDFPWEQFPQSEANLVYARSLGAARSGDPAAAKRGVERLVALRDELRRRNLDYWVEQVDIQRQAAEAWIALAEGKKEEALEAMRAAADREDRTDKHPVTPGPLVPVRELLAEMLLELDQPSEALKEFQASQQVEPNRFRGLYGMARAAELAGATDEATASYRKLLELAGTEDGERPELVKTREFLAAAPSS